MTGIVTAYTIYFPCSISPRLHPPPPTPHFPTPYFCIITASDTDSLAACHTWIYHLHNTCESICLAGKTALSVELFAQICPQSLGSRRPVAPLHWVDDVWCYHHSTPIHPLLDTEINRMAPPINLPSFSFLPSFFFFFFFYVSPGN